MKRVLAVLLTGVLAIGMTMTAFAAESVEGTDEVGIIGDASVAEESETDVTISLIDSDSEYYDAASELYDDTDNEILASVTDADPDEFELAYLFDVTTDDEAGTFAVYIGSGYTSVVVLHYNGEDWEPVEVDYDSESGLLTIYADDYSPFAVYVSTTSDYSYTADEEEDEDEDEEDEDADDEDADDEDADDEESEGTSDATGEGTYVLYIVALAALAGLAVSAKMKRA